MSQTASVTLMHKQSNQRATLNPGEYIGRSEVAALCIDDPRVSEAHAMVSLRDGHLKLIALRGRFRHKSQVLSEIILKPDLVLELAPDIHVVCEHVNMPTSVLGLIIDQDIEVRLTNTITLYAGDLPTLKRGYDPYGDAIFWDTALSWRMRTNDDASVILSAGDHYTINGTDIKVVAIPLEHAQQTKTRNSLRAPITFTCHDMHVEMDRTGEPTVKLSGIPGRIFLSLLKRQGTASYQEVVHDVWSEDYSTDLSLRRRFDTGMRRLRAQLRLALPDEEPLITLDGTGIIKLNRLPKDQIVHAP